MRIRPITSDELALFAATATRADDQHAILGYLERLLERGQTRPAWCFVLDDGADVLGRVAYWALPGKPAPSDLVLLDVPWADADLELGNRLLADTVQRMRLQGAADLNYVVDLPPRPPQWQHVPERRHDLLTRFGWTLVRTTRRFAWPTPAPVPAARERLTFRSLADSGEGAVLRLLERAMRGSPDQRTQADRAALGAEGAALQLYRLLQSLGYEAAWWQVGSTADGTAVGLLMPCGTPAWGTIGYIGVVPEHRGHGYIDELLAQATQTLVALGAERIEADTDVANRPMANAFARGGWMEFGTRREYHLPATTDPARHAPG